MAKTGKKQFKFTGSENLVLRSRGEDVASLQAILSSLGFLRGAYEPGSICSGTERAVRRYQRFYRLKVDGVVGPKTKEMLARKRCGVPDLPTNLSGSAPAAPFVLRGCQYSKRELTYTFLNGTADLAGTREREIVRNAFAAWQNVADLRFTETDDAGSADFRVAWRSADHGDGSSFDGPGNTLAHAFYPPPCGGPSAGDMHFDEHETWIEDPGGQGTLLQQVAIHEIGHLLGLRHSAETEAIMYAYYSPDRTHLTDDDIAGVRALYGEPSRSTEVRLQTEIAGSLARTADEKIFRVRIPETLAVSIDGPPDADFDLYVRKNEPPTVDSWDYRAYTVSADERIVFPVDAGTTYHVMVRSYEGGGDFRLKLEPPA